MSCVARSFFFAVLVLLVSRPAAAESLLINGDFSLGNTGFTSQYVNAAMPGGYIVGSDPVLAFGGTFSSFGDHTTGTGLMFMADGSLTPNRVVWQETVSVPSATTPYVFSGWAASSGQFPGGSHIDPSPAQLRFFVNNVQIGSDFTVPAQNGQWAQFSASTNFAASGIATIQIVDQNTAFIGNDFTLDDLSFAAVPEPASIVILGTGVLGLVCYGWRKAR